MPKGFQKGHIPWHAGTVGIIKNGFKKGQRRIWTEETKKKVSAALMGNKNAVGLIPWNKGKIGVQIPSIETREKMRKNNSHYWLNRKLSEESKRKMSIIRKGRIPWNKGRSCPKGEKSNNWRGGITPLHRRIRTSLEYKLWRKSVFERDHYTCTWCGIKSQKGIKVILNADHIKPFALYPELRFAIDNGRTLCI